MPDPNANRACTVDEGKRLAECRLPAMAPGVRVSLPWGEVWVGEEKGQGAEIWVEAREPFTLLLHGLHADYFEYVQPGTSRYLLTVLDRTDVYRED